MKHFLNLLDQETFVLRFSPRLHFHETPHWKHGHFPWPFWLQQSSLFWWRQMEEMTFFWTDSRHLRKWRGRCEGRSQLRGSRSGDVSQVGRDLSLWSQARNWVGVVWGHTVPCPSQWPLKLSLVKCLFSLWEDHKDSAQGMASSWSLEEHLKLIIELHEWSKGSLCVLALALLYSFTAECRLKPITSKAYWHWTPFFTYPIILKIAQTRWFLAI